MPFWPRTSIALWLAALALAAAVLARAPITADLTAFLPDSATREQALLVEQLRDGVAARLVLIALEGAPEAVLAGASRALVERLGADRQFRFVANGAAERFAADRKLFERFRYVLSPAVTPERFTAASLHQSLEGAIALLASPASTLVTRSLPADPTGEVLQVLGLLEGARQPEMREGVWFSADGRRALAIAETAAPGFDTAAQTAAQAAIARAFEDAFAGPPPAGARLVLAGPSVFAVQARADIERDAWRLSLIATACVTLILLLTYRSLPLALAGALPVATGLACGIAAVGLVFGSIHGITLGFGATLIGEAVDYPTYLLTNRRSGEPMRTALARIWPTLRLAILTTVFSGLTMLLSSFRGLAQLGVLLVVGILAAGLTTRWVLPALGLERFGARQCTALVPALDPARLARAPRWAGGLVVLAVIAALAFLAARHDRLWDDDLENLSPVSEAAKNLDGELRAELGAPDVRYLVVASGASADAALAAAESLEPALRALVAENVMAGFDSPAHFLPSAARQAARRAALPDPATLEQALVVATRDTPFRPETFRPFVAAVAAARVAPALALADLEGSSAGLKVRSLLAERAGQWIALVPLAAVSDGATLAARLAPALGGEAVLLDLKAESNRMVASYRGESLRLTALGLAAILAVLAIGLRSVRGVIGVFVPVLAAAVVDVALLNALGVRLSLFHLVALLLVIGAGLNYALFFNRPEHSPAERARTSLALVVCGSTTLCAFGALATSPMPVLKAIGLTVGLGIVLAFGFAAVLARYTGRPVPDGT